MRNRKDVLCMTNIYSLEMPLAQNLPAEVIMRLENPVECLLIRQPVFLS